MKRSKKHKRINEQDFSPNVFFGPATDEQIRAADVAIGCPESGGPKILFGEHHLERIVRRNTPEKLMMLVIPVRDETEMANLVARISQIKDAQAN